MAISKDLDIDMWGFKITHSKTQVIHDTISNVKSPLKIVDTTLKKAPIKARKYGVISSKTSPQLKPTIIDSNFKKHQSSNSQPQITAKNYAGVNLGGQVGDNYYGVIPEFNEADGNQFVNTIEQYRRDSSITSKSIIINAYINSNDAKYGSDLYNWLKANNYRVSIRTNRIMKTPFDGIEISFDKSENCFEVHIGNYRPIK